MAVEDRRSPVRIVGNPLHPLLASIPFTCFTGALLTDIAYWQSATMQWANFSAWLLAAGLFVAAFAIIVGLIDFMTDREHALGVTWAYAGGNVLALVLAIINSFVHSRDAYTSVVPEGLILSALTVLIMLVTGWMGWELVYRHRLVTVEDRS
ncbi:MAG TPA: DUF2231 domain-containing protein [Rhizomicrobium sp.]|jgi:uncharacterized membrane protein|nr:DUF2231 domain-containing protein [Rhizomicrobium sp.]